MSTRLMGLLIDMDLLQSEQGVEGGKLEFYC